MESRCIAPLILILVPEGIHQFHVPAALQSGKKISTTSQDGLTANLDFVQQ
jgi:hypothetical protein